MKISDNGIGLIKRFEGFKANAYRCPAGVITIGYGHTGPELKMGDRVTRKKAESILQSDLEWAEDVVSNSVKVDLSQNQFDALVSFVFNIGEGAFKKSTLLRLLNKGDYEAVPRQLARWNKAKGMTLAGLTRRRQAEADMWLEGASSKHPMAQRVDAPEKPLAKDGSVINATVAGGASLAALAAPAIEPAGEVVTIVQENPQGALYVAGAIIALFAIVAVYLQWKRSKE